MEKRRSVIKLEPRPEATPEETWQERKAHRLDVKIERDRLYAENRYRHQLAQNPSGSEREPGPNPHLNRKAGPIEAFLCWVLGGAD